MNQTTSDHDQIAELDRQWAAAEVRGDSAALAELSTEDFMLVGPVGFVLDRDQWLARYPDGGLITRSLVWDELTVRVHGDAAIVIGRHTQEGTFQGHPVDGAFRSTHIAVRREGRWRLVGVHLSTIGGRPPFRPPTDAA